VTGIASWKERPAAMAAIAQALTIPETDYTKWKSSPGTRVSGFWSPQERASVADLDQDALMVERCLRGEEAAWEDLVKTHTRRVYSICLRFTSREQEAQDLTQEVFLRVFRTVKSFRAGEGSFTVWLTRLTRNLLIDNYRRTKSERVTDSIEDQLPMLEEKTAIESRTDSMLAGREASEVLQGALARLSPELREAVILRDLEGMEYREIAGALGVPEGTVKSRLNRGRTELARILRRQKVVV
jgi:RNA polymerase sigma-70 factor (ECF subfamily)